jgi:hypothetical protein
MVNQKFEVQLGEADLQENEGVDIDTKLWLFQRIRYSMEFHTFTLIYFEKKIYWNPIFSKLHSGFFLWYKVFCLWRSIWWNRYYWYIIYLSWKLNYLGIIPKIKHTNLSAHSKGFVLKSKAEAEGANTRHSFHLLKQSIREFEAALAVDTTNKITLRWKSNHVLNHWIVKEILQKHCISLDRCSGHSFGINM